MSRFLVTDPCYVVPKDEWLEFLELTGYGDGLPEGGYRIEGFGTITDIEHSDGGDGEWKVGNGKSVCADAGLTCIVELDEGVVPTEYQGNAVTRTRGVAEHWFSRVVGHECFQ